MKILVSYYSQTGNTEKVARSINNALQQENSTILPLKEAREQLADYDLIVFGFPIQAHSVPVPAQDFIRRIPEGKKLGLFSTHGCLNENRLAQEALTHASGLAKNVKLLGSFHCRGAVPDETVEYLENQPEHRVWINEARSADSHPDAADLQDAEIFARGVLKKALDYSDFNKR